MAVDQVAIFAQTEGDRWFERNRASLTSCDVEHDFPLRLIELYSLRPRSVLEIGASNGFRVAALAARGVRDAVAVEASAAAIRDGAARFPDVQFIRATADAIPLHRTFELVIVNFVLHWVDRTRLLTSVGEIDRLVADGGYLLLGDFHPARPTRVPYHHLPDQAVYTYKQAYGIVFRASGLYQPIAMLSGDHTGHELRANVPEDDRVATWLLRKSLQGNYTERHREQP